MIRRLALCRSLSTDPYRNLAVEELLLRTVEEGCCVLYLWQNQNTVVIGRNQNAWLECRTALLEEEGGRLARRLSGGGAVFHDLGNLNFTFLVPTADYDLDKQLRVIETACGLLGVRAERSGRNDVLAEGRKISGNAFYQSGGRSYHHGTLLVDVDMARLGRYLSPPKAKLEAKGVSSVRSRVGNLRDFVPGLTIEDMAQAMARAFSQVYGLPWEALEIGSLDGPALAELESRNRSWEWNYGRQLPLTFDCQGRFPWGGVQLQLQVEDGLVREARVYSDAMDWRVAPALEAALTGCRFRLEDLCRAAEGACPDVAGDLKELLREQEI